MVLTSGAMAGIVVAASAVGIALVVALIYCVCRRQRRREGDESGARGDRNSKDWRRLYDPDRKPTVDGKAVRVLEGRNQWMRESDMLGEYYHQQPHLEKHADYRQEDPFASEHDYKPLKLSSPLPPMDDDEKSALQTQQAAPNTLAPPPPAHTRGGGEDPGASLRAARAELLAAHERMSVAAGFGSPLPAPSRATTPLDSSHRDSGATGANDVISFAQQQRDLPATPQSAPRTRARAGTAGASTLAPPPPMHTAERDSTAFDRAKREFARDDDAASSVRGSTDVEQRFRHIMDGMVGRSATPRSPNACGPPPPPRKAKTDTIMDVTDSYGEEEHLSAAEGESPPSASHLRCPLTMRLTAPAVVVPEPPRKRTSVVVPPPRGESRRMAPPSSLRRDNSLPVLHEAETFSPARRGSQLDLFPPPPHAAAEPAQRSPRARESTQTASSWVPSLRGTGRVDSKPLRDLEDILDSFNASQHDYSAGTIDPDLYMSEDSSMEPLAPSPPPAAQGRQPIAPLTLHHHQHQTGALVASPSENSLAPPPPLSRERLAAQPRDLGNTSTGNGEMHYHTLSIYSSAGEVGEYPGVSGAGSSGSGTPRSGGSVASSPTKIRRIESPERTMAPAQIVRKVSLTRPQPPVLVGREDSIRRKQQEFAPAHTESPTAARRRVFAELGFEGHAKADESFSSSSSGHSHGFGEADATASSMGHTLATSPGSSPSPQTPRDEAIFPRDMLSVPLHHPLAGSGGGAKARAEREREYLSPAHLDANGFVPLAHMNADMSYESATLDLLSTDAYAMSRASTRLSDCGPPSPTSPSPMQRVH